MPEPLDMRQLDASGRGFDEAVRVALLRKVMEHGRDVREEPGSIHVAEEVQRRSLWRRHSHGAGWCLEGRHRRPGEFALPEEPDAFAPDHHGPLASGGHHLEFLRCLVCGSVQSGRC